MAVSVLFQQTRDRLAEDQLKQPGFFADLNFDQIVTAIIADKEEYNLQPFFYMPLQDTDAVAYRHEVMQDLKSPSLLKIIEAFSENMQDVRDNFAQTKERYHELQNERWILDAANMYIETVRKLTNDLSKQKLKSRGLLAIKKYLDSYLASKQFIVLAEQAHQIESELNAIRYEVLIEGLRVEVRHYKNEPNYSSEIQTIFKRFSQESDTEYSYGFRDQLSMNQVEERILDLVAQNYSSTFSKLADFCTKYKHFMDATIVQFDREIQFYIAYLEYIAKLQKAGLQFCYPSVSQTSKEVLATKSFDLALANKLVGDNKLPVTNDFYLKGAERIIVVSGPNQGGKTTFARTFGQLHYLASLGLLTPGTKGQFFLSDTILTHFEKEEKMTNLRGKLEDDLLRMHAILEAATPRSIILINEIFTSTTLHDAVLLSKKIADSIMKLDALCVWITFIDEISLLSAKTVSMVSEVAPDKPAVRTFKVVRKPADGLAYAIAIAQKHRLTSSMIKRRIKS